MRKIIKRLTTASTWAASTDMTPVDLPRDGLITEVTVRANLTATLTATAYDDWFRRHLQNIKIEGDGGRAYVGMSGTQMSVVADIMQIRSINIPDAHHAVVWHGDDWYGNGKVVHDPSLLKHPDSYEPTGWFVLARVIE